jgi:putative membrane protein
MMLAVTAMIAVSAKAQDGYGHHAGWGVHDFGFGGLLMWILLAVLAGIVVYMAVRQHDAGRRDSGDRTPLEILRRRYASGEISRDEYERMKSDLTETP